MYKKLNKSYKTKPKHRRLKRKSLKKKWMKWIGGQEGDDDDFPGAEMSVRKPDVILKDLQKEDEKAKEVRNKINELMEKKNEMNGDAYEEGMDKLMNDATAVKENVDKLVEEMEDPRVGAITDQLQDAERIQNIADKIVKIGADIRVKPAEVIGQPTSFDDLALKPAKVVSSTSPLGNDNYQAPGEPAAAAAANRNAFAAGKRTINKGIQRYCGRLSQKQNHPAVIRRTGSKNTGQYCTGRTCIRNHGRRGRKNMPCKKRTKIQRIKRKGKPPGKDIETAGSQPRNRSGRYDPAIRRDDHGTAGNTKNRSRLFTHRTGIPRRTKKIPTKGSRDPVAANRTPNAGK